MSQNFMKIPNTHFLGRLGAPSTEFEFVLDGFDESERFGVTRPTADWQTGTLTLELWISYYD